MKTRYPVALLTISLAGIAFIQQEEGQGPQIIENGQKQAVAYADPAHGWGVPTICAGHTKGVFKGQKAGLDQCQQWLIEDVTASGAAIKRCTPVSMTQGQYDALLSLVHNIGPANYCRSGIARQINAGNCRAAAREINQAPQQDQTGQPRRWQGKPIREIATGKILLSPGQPIMKWTTAAGIPMPGLITRRAKERAAFEKDCDIH